LGDAHGGYDAYETQTGCETAKKGSDHRILLGNDGGISGCTVYERSMYIPSDSDRDTLLVERQKRQ
jgi:hypothetical protein